jgi:hypothetical protein
MCPLSQQGCWLFYAPRRDPVIPAPAGIQILLRPFAFLPLALALTPNSCYNTFMKVERDGLGAREMTSENELQTFGSPTNMHYSTSSGRVYGITTIVVALVSFSSLSLAESPVSVHRERFEGYLAPMSMSVARSKCSSRGYSTETVEQIMGALDSPEGSVRMSALILLVAQAGERATPVLKKALGDASVLVRLRAAELLGSLGDASGVPVLREDYESLVPKGENPDPKKVDPNAPKVALKGNTLYSVVAIAQILARFDDSRGFEQAARVLAGDNWAHRLDALKVLFTINMCIDRAQLLAEKRDPEPLLIRAAESEKELFVLREFLKHAQSHTRGSLRQTLLEKVEKSLKVAEEAQSRAKESREQLERSSKKRK